MALASPSNPREPAPREEEHGLILLCGIPVVLFILLMCPQDTLATAAQESSMHIEFERSGGFAGLRLATTIDSNTISSEDATALRDMIRSASFFELPAKSEKGFAGADRFHYRVIVEIEERRHAIEIEESVVPPSLRPLINWLTDKAKRR